MRELLDDLERDGGGDFVDRELVDMALLLLVAGFETTSNLIGDAVVTFDRQPEQWELLRSTPALAQGLAMELLRHDTSIQLLHRVAVSDVEVGGAIPTGDAVLAALGAANRDPAVFADPDRMDLRRTDVRPLSFGGGIHHCLGAALAAVEIEVLFAEMARRYPTIDLVGGPPRHRSRLLFRGPASIELRVGCGTGEPLGA